MRLPALGVIVYRGTSHIRKHHLVGSYSRAMRRALVPYSRAMPKDACFKSAMALQSSSNPSDSAASASGFFATACFRVYGLSFLIKGYRCSV